MLFVTLGYVRRCLCTTDLACWVFQNNDNYMAPVAHIPMVWRCQCV